MPAEPDALSVLFEGRRYEVVHVPLVELVEWRTRRGLMPVVRVQFGPRTWPPMVLYERIEDVKPG
jgi:hypothetical protein